MHQTRDHRWEDRNTSAARSWRTACSRSMIWYSKTSTATPADQSGIPRSTTPDLTEGGRLPPERRLPPPCPGPPPRRPSVASKAADQRRHVQVPGSKTCEITAPSSLFLPLPLLWPQSPLTTAADGTKTVAAVSMPGHDHLKPRRCHVARAFYPAVPPAAVEGEEEARGGGTPVR